MCLATSYLVDFVGDLAHIDGCGLVSEGAKSELAILASTAREKSSNIVDEGRVLRATVYLLNIGSIVAVKIH